MVNVQPELYRLEEVLAGLSLTREELIDLAILVGTDFNEGVSGVGAKTALKLIKKNEFGSVISAKLPGFDPDPVRELFLHPPVNDSPDFEWKKPDHDRIIAYLSEGYGFSEERISPVLEKLTGRGKQRTLDSWF
jgi:flap endonuclease-1